MSPDEQILFSILSVITYASDHNDEAMLASAIRALKIAEAEIAQRAVLADSSAYDQSQLTAH